MSINRDDLFRDKFVTGNGPLTGSVLYSMSIPDNLEFIAQVADCLYSLCIDDNWEQGGTVTVDDATQAAITMFWSFRPMVGTIFPVLWDTIGDNYLICDGSSYLRVDYPALYANLPAAFIVDADNFTVPDLSGRVVMGPNGSHNVGDLGGEETHTLSTGEIPAHTHAESTAVASFAEVPVAPIPSATPGIGVTGSTGGGGSHNNLQPYQVLTYVIVAR